MKNRKRKKILLDDIYGNTDNNYIDNSRKDTYDIYIKLLEEKNKRLENIRNKLHKIHDMTNMKFIPIKIRFAYIALNKNNCSDYVCIRIIKKKILLKSCIHIYNLFYNYVFPYKFAMALDISLQYNYQQFLIKEFIRDFYSNYLLNEKLINIDVNDFITIQCKNIIGYNNNIKRKRDLEHFLHKKYEYAIDFIGIIFKYNKLSKLRLEHIFEDNNISDSD